MRAFLIRPWLLLNLGRSYRTAVLAALILSLSGCGFLSGAGPYASSIADGSQNDQGYTLVDLEPSTLRPYLRPKDRVLSSNVAKVLTPDVMLVPGDVIKVLVADSVQGGVIFAPLASGGTVFQSIRVDAKGNISIPYAGRLPVVGLTLPQVEATVSRALSGVVAEPQVHIELVGDLSGSVLVAGAVKSPGRFSALQGPLTLLDAINMAGGPQMEPHLATITVRTGSSVMSFNYQEVLAGNNISIPPRSEIVVERAKKRFVAMGAVGKPGLHDMPSEFPSLLEVLGEIGGLDERSADPRGVFIFRMSTSDGVVAPQAEVIRLNMRSPGAIFLARQFLIQPEDAIYVTNAAVYEWQKIIAPIAQTLVFGQRLDAL